MKNVSSDQLGQFNRIDLPEESQGSLCLLCDVTGEHETARLLDPDLGPVCYECFAISLNVLARLAWLSAMDGRAVR